MQKNKQLKYEPNGRFAVLRNEPNLANRGPFCKNEPNRPLAADTIGRSENTNPIAHFCHVRNEPIRGVAIPADEKWVPQRRDRRSRKPCNIKLSNNCGPTLRTPCGEKESARFSASLKIACGRPRLATPWKMRTGKWLTFQPIRTRK
jgi:hypothetical protein